MRRALAAIAAAGGVLALLAGSPYPLDVQRLARAVAREEDHVTAVELAAWIRGRKPGLRIIDLRTPAEFKDYHLPRAENVAIDALPSMPFRSDETIVLVSGAGGHAAQGWVFLQALGNRNVFFLRGGQEEWLEAMKQPEIGRYFGGVRRRDGC